MVAQSTESMCHRAGHLGLARRGTWSSSRPRWIGWRVPATEVERQDVGLVLQRRVDDRRRHTDESEAPDAGEGRSPITLDDRLYVVARDVGDLDAEHRAAEQERRQHHEVQHLSRAHRRQNDADDASQTTQEHSIDLDRGARVLLLGVAALRVGGVGRVAVVAVDQRGRRGRRAEGVAFDGRVLAIDREGRSSRHGSNDSSSLHRRHGRQCAVEPER